MLYAGFIGEDFMLMQDNAQLRTAAVLTQYLREVEIPVMEWPA